MPIGKQLNESPVQGDMFWCIKVVDVPYNWITGSNVPFHFLLYCVVCKEDCNFIRPHKGKKIIGSHPGVMVKALSHRRRGHKFKCISTVLFSWIYMSTGSNAWALLFFLFSFFGYTWAQLCDPKQESREQFEKFFHLMGHLGMSKQEL